LAVVTVFFLYGKKSFNRQSVQEVLFIRILLDALRLGSASRNIGTTLKYFFSVMYRHISCSFFFLCIYNATVSIQKCSVSFITVYQMPVFGAVEGAGDALFFYKEVVPAHRDLITTVDSRGNMSSSLFRIRVQWFWNYRQYFKWIMSRKKSYFLVITVFWFLENCNLANFRGKSAKIIWIQQSTKPVEISLVYNKNRFYPHSNMVSSCK
jgi:hypothetical protein